jgi:hypothetical protein
MPASLWPVSLMPMLVGLAGLGLQHRRTPSYGFGADLAQRRLSPATRYPGGLTARRLFPLLHRLPPAALGRSSASTGCGCEAEGGR